MSDGFDDAYGGILTSLSSIPRRAADPDVPLWGGVLPPWGPRRQEMAVGGAGWDDHAARDACIGEAVERLQAYPLPGDEIVESSVSEWSREEPAIGPERWTLFHPDQYRVNGFPFMPFTRDTRCRWVCFREAGTGAAHWIPEELAYLFHAPGDPPRFSPSYSTGLSCGRTSHPILLRGLQETVERDGVVGAWWGRYPIEEWDGADVLARLDPSISPRVLRPNRRYRFYRVRSPFSGHVTIVTVQGEDREGFLFAAGSACRETLPLSWTKSLLEAIQGAAYVRRMRSDRPDPGWVDERADYGHHAAYYSVHPERLEETVLHRADAPVSLDPTTETLSSIRERLGAGRPVLFRIMTPPGIAEELRDWLVLRVVVPGLQPLHGDDRWAHLGGPLWDRPVADWIRTPPHPFA